MEKQNKSKLTQWLELLQQESWQLELIITGFAIFLVGSLHEPLMSFVNHIKVVSQGVENNFALSVPFAILLGAWFFLLVNLIFHVILRGLWISTIGLRYVSGEIDFDELNFHPRFDRFIRKKTLSYDEYIERLEKFCSVVFALTFMIIFMIIALGLYFTGLYILIDLFAQEFIDSFSPKAADVISIILAILWNVGGLLFLIDFVTLGWLKRKNWAAKVYYPIYRFFSFITLAFIYRPIYYNLIDNRFSKKIAYFLVPYVILAVIVSSISTDFHPYFPNSQSRDNNYFTHNFYDDLRDDKEAVINLASIPSKYLNNRYLELFVGYKSRTHDKVIQKICPDLKPLVNTGMKVTAVQLSINPDEIGSPDTALTCISQLYKIYVNDSLFEAPKYRFYSNPAHGEKGVLTILDLNYLERGEQLLKIETQAIRKDSLYWRDWAEFPFWVE
jgi:hypothetical protein